MPNTSTAAAIPADSSSCPPPAVPPVASDARERVLALLRDALRILDDELDEGVVGAKLSECIERLAEPGQHGHPVDIAI